jgi:hypothetical protein
VSERFVEEREETLGEEVRLAGPPNGLVFAVSDTEARPSSVIDPRMIVRGPRWNWDGSPNAAATSYSRYPE